MKRLALILTTLALLAAPAFAQVGYIHDQAFGVNPFSPGAGATPSPIFLPFAQVRYCTVPASGTQCTPLATVFDTNGNPLTVPPGGFGQITADVTGSYNIQCSAGNYLVQVFAVNNNNPQRQYSLTCPLSSVGGGGGTVGGSGTTGNLSVWTAATTLGNSVATDDGTKLILPTGIQLGGTLLNGSGGGTWTLRTTTDNVVGAGTVDTFTNKKFNTASAGNELRINGNVINDFRGSGSIIALTNSPTFSGTPIVPTQSLSDNSTEAVNSAWVKGQGYISNGVSKEAENFSHLSGNPSTGTFMSIASADIAVGSVFVADIDGAVQDAGGGGGSTSIQLVIGGQSPTNCDWGASSASNHDDILTGSLHVLIHFTAIGASGAARIQCSGQFKTWQTIGGNQVPVTSSLVSNQTATVTTSIPTTSAVALSFQCTDATGGALTCHYYSGTILKIQ